MRQADVAVRNKDGLVAFMVATKAGHDNVKAKLQPVGSALTTQMKDINTAEQFHEARLFVKDYGLSRLKHEMGAPPRRDIGTAPLVSTHRPESTQPSSAPGPRMSSAPHSPSPHTLPVAPGFVNKETYQLTTDTTPFNVFARAGAGLLGPGNADDNAALERAGRDYAKRFKVWRNRPENDENWEKGGKWAGVASMSARHRSDERLEHTRANPNPTLTLTLTGLMSVSNTRARV